MVPLCHFTKGSRFLPSLTKSNMQVIMALRIQSTLAGQLPFKLSHTSVGGISPPC